MISNGTASFWFECDINPRENRLLALVSVDVMKGEPLVLWVSKHAQMPDRGCYQVQKSSPNWKHSLSLHVTTLVSCVSLRRIIGKIGEDVVRELFCEEEEKE